ncbi:MAG: outer membrane beta-barrel protein [Bacteroidota bacterium]
MIKNVPAILLNKTIILSFILFFAFVKTSNAQYRFGLFGGLNISSHTGKDFTTTDFPKTGMTAGFFYEREIDKTLSWVIAPSFEQKGAKYTFEPRFDTRVEVNNDLDYFTLPLLLKANFSKRPNYNRKASFGRQMNYYVTGGISLSYLISHPNEVHTFENDVEIDSGPFFPYSYNNVDASISIGGGVMWREIFIDLKYIHGIRNLYSGKNVPVIRNHIISLTLAYSLYHKKNVPCRKR